MSYDMIDLALLKQFGNVRRNIIEKTGHGVLSGLTVSAQATPDLTVTVAAGVCYMANGDRFSVAKVDALEVVPYVAYKGIVYVDVDGAVKFLSGEGTPAVAGSRAYTIATNAVADDTVTIGGVEFTAVAEDPEGAQFIPGEDEEETAANLAEVIAEDETITADYACTVSGAIITLTEKEAGGGDTPGAATFTGTVVITNGDAVTSAAAIAPAAFPATPTGAILLAEIAAVAGAASIGSGNITNKIVPLGFSVPGDMEVTGVGRGVIIASPNGTRYRITVANNGTLSAVSIS